MIQSHPSHYSTGYYNRARGFVRPRKPFAERVLATIETVGGTRRYPKTCGAVGPRRAGFGPSGFYPRKNL